MCTFEIHEIFVVVVLLVLGGFLIFEFIFSLYVCLSADGDGHSEVAYAQLILTLQTIKWNCLKIHLDHLAAAAAAIIAHKWKFN